MADGAAAAVEVVLEDLEEEVLAAAELEEIGNQRKENACKKTARNLPYTLRRT